MSKRWINTKVEFQWDKELQQYVEILSEGYWYDGDMAYAVGGAGPSGGSGGAGGTGVATTRIDVMDPHLLIQMRDVMSSGSSAERLNKTGS